MKAKGEADLMCDFAETYNIYDYHFLPVRTVAILAAGLPAESRIKRKLSGQKHSVEIILLANIADALNLLTWLQSKDGARNINRPKSILSELMEEKESFAEYGSIEEYEAARRKIMEG